MSMGMTLKTTESFVAINTHSAIRSGFSTAPELGPAPRRAIFRSMRPINAAAVDGVSQ